MLCTKCCTTYVIFLYSRCQQSICDLRTTRICSVMLEPRTTQRMRDSGGSKSPPLLGPRPGPRTAGAPPSHAEASPAVPALLQCLSRAFTRRGTRLGGQRGDWGPSPSGGSESPATAIHHRGGQRGATARRCTRRPPQGSGHPARPPGGRSAGAGGRTARRSMQNRRARAGGASGAAPSSQHRSRPPPEAGCLWRALGRC